MKEERTNIHSPVDAMRQRHQNEDSDRREAHFSVKGMTCAACQAAVERAVKRVEGVVAVDVQLMMNSMEVQYHAPASIEEIEQAVKYAGYEAQEKGRYFGDVHDVSPSARSGAMAESQDVFREQAEAMKRSLFVSIPLLLCLMYVAMGSMWHLPLPEALTAMEGSANFVLVQALLTLPILFVNRHYFQRGFRSLWHRAPNMDALIAVGASAAVAYGIFAWMRINYGLGFQQMELVHLYRHDLYFESAAMILTLITLGKYLEARSKIKTTGAVQALMELQPPTARRMRNGQVEEVPIESVQVGDWIQLRPGERIPLDGIVLKGQSTVDESAITGESMPVLKQKGDLVTGATMNKTGTLVFEATAVGEETTLAKIIQLVERANATKAPIQNLADRVASWFVPAVIAIAVVTFTTWFLLGAGLEFALRLGISVLVISCPCALGLATPVVIMVATGKGAELGILMKSAEALERLHHVKTILFDKTGTLTEGKPRVTDVYLAEGEEPLGWIYALESSSEQPLAEAIVNYAKAQGVEMMPTEDFTAEPGRGVQGTVHGEVVLGGNQAWMEQHGVDVQPVFDLAERLAAEGKTPMYFARAGRIVALLAAADTVKNTSVQAVQALKRRSITPVMLTGDHEKTAHAIAAKLGIDRVIAHVRPEEKEQKVREAREEGQLVAMVGDGINDAPALSSADVGIAIGAGTDVAMESADLVLMHSDLQDVVHAIDLSEQALKKIKQNLFWAFIYNVICIPVAAGVFYPLFDWTLNPMIASAAMSLSSVFVVTNALLLNRFSVSHTVQYRREEKEGKVHIDRFKAQEGFSKSIVEEKMAQKLPVEFDSGEEKNMRILKIEGMSCQHCQNHVQKALDALGVQAEVSLEEACARVKAPESISDEQLKAAVEEAGYRVTAVER